MGTAGESSVENSEWLHMTVLPRGTLAWASSGRVGINALLLCLGSSFSIGFVTSSGDSFGAGARGLVPAIIPRWYMTMAIKPTITRRATTTPTAIPAMAPLDNPEEEG